MNCLCVARVLRWLDIRPLTASSRAAPLGFSIKIFRQGPRDVSVFRRSCQSFCGFLDCVSPLALFDQVPGRKSGRGLPQSKTLSRQRTHVSGSGPNAFGKTKGALHELSFCPRTNQFQRAARGYARVRAITVQPVFLNSNSSPLAVTLILSPGLNSPSSSLIESGSSSFSWIARLSGRAPNCGS